MALRMHTLEEKLAVIDRLIVETRDEARSGSVEGADIHSILKDIATELRARLELPRSQTLGAMERALFQVVRSKTSLGYDETKLVAVANVVIHKWPTIRQALERYGEESAE